MIIIILKVDKKYNKTIPKQITNYSKYKIHSEKTLEIGKIAI